jgi:hypothetical protein
MFCQVVDGCIPVFVGDMAAKRRQKLKPREIFQVQSKSNSIQSPFQKGEVQCHQN